MITACDFINTVIIALNEAGGYIWGYAGQVHTAQKQSSATRDTTVRYGAQWVGRRCWDCSGLIAWAFAQYGESIYHGSDTQYRQYCSAKGALKNGARADGLPLRPGTAVFLCRDGNMHHVGVYIGGGRVVEAKSTLCGVVESDIGCWDNWGELRDVDYSGDAAIDPRPMLRPGMKGDAVKELQQFLAERGADCAADGVFGPKTYAALRRYQRSAGLPETGTAEIGPDGLVPPAAPAAESGEDRDAYLLLLRGDRGAMTALQKQHGGVLYRECDPQ